MMWMLRPEFDREACFYAVGGVRGSLEWDDLCNMQLPVPSIEKQREIVKEYLSSLPPPIAFRRLCFIGIQGAKLILMTGEAWSIVLQNFLSTLSVYGV